MTHCLFQFPDRVLLLLAQFGTSVHSQFKSLELRRTILALLSQFFEFGELGTELLFVLQAAHVSLNLQVFPLYTHILPCKIRHIYTV